MKLLITIRYAEICQSTGWDVHSGFIYEIVKSELLFPAVMREVLMSAYKKGVFMFFPVI